MCLLYRTPRVILCEYIHLLLTGDLVETGKK